MSPKQENLPLARRLALETLSRSDLQERALQSGGCYGIDPEGRGGIGLKYLGSDLWLSFPEGRFVTPNGHGPISPREEILIFHYLERADGTPLTNRWIAFGNIPSGAFYAPVFQKRCKEPLLRSFGEQPEALRTVAAAMAAQPIALGDVAFRIQAFPMVPLALVMWRGDADFGPEGNILFDASVSRYLPVEDTVVLAETVVWKLVKAKK